MADSTVYSTAINPGAPPLRWDNVYEAFRQVNANFEMIEAALGSAGITPVNFNDLDSGVSPADTNTFTLGTMSKQWKSVHTAEWVDVAGSELNGLWAGNAHIKGIGYTIDLPVNSTVDGNLIIDPAKVWFNEIQVDNNESVVATSVNDSFNILSGTGISMNVDSSGESITVSNTGIITASAGLGINVSGTNPLTITNTGVRSISNSGSIGTRTPGLGIHTSSSTGTPLLTNTGVLEIVAGSGALIVSTDAVTGIVTITNNSPAQPAFQQVEVDADSANRLVADSTAGVLKVVSGYGITLGKTVGTDTLTINVNPAHDIKGSVFGDDSSVLVDGVNNYIYGNVSATTLRTAETKIALGNSAGSISQGNNATAVGWLAGYNTQGTAAVAVGREAGEINQGQYAVSVGPGAGYTGQGGNAVAIGYDAGFTAQGSAGVAIGYLSGNNTQESGAVAIGYTTAQVTQRTGAVAIGWSAGQTNQGANAIAIGFRAGFLNQDAGSIILNASGAALNSTGAGFYVNPVRSTTSSARPLVYNASTSEIFYTSTLEFINSTISTTDSSGITVDVQTTFNTDVTFENDIIVAERLTVKGSRVINLAELKSVVAASSSFADFQTRIAALV